MQTHFAILGVQQGCAHPPGVPQEYRHHDEHAGGISRNGDFFSVPP
jgi:hypothetical protein